MPNAHDRLMHISIAPSPKSNTQRIRTNIWLPTPATPSSTKLGSSHRKTWTRYDPMLVMSMNILQMQWSLRLQNFVIQLCGHCWKAQYGHSQILARELIGHANCNGFNARRQCVLVMGRLENSCSTVLGFLLVDAPTTLIFFNLRLYRGGDYVKVASNYRPANN